MTAEEMLARLVELLEEERVVPVCPACETSAYVGRIKAQGWEGWACLSCGGQLAPRTGWQA